MATPQMIVQALSPAAVDALRSSVADIGREHRSWTGRHVETGYYFVPSSAREIVLRLAGVIEIDRAISLSCCLTD